MSAPLPFVGQKRMFAGEYKRLLGNYDDATVFVDLFGGSGLLSHITKRQRPNATVVYNDYDNYRRRIDNIDNTNRILDNLRELLAGQPRLKAVPADIKAAILSMLEREEAETGFVDYITLSSSLLFSGKRAASLGQLRRQTMYNCVRRGYYDAEGYLEGLEIVSCDYRELFDRYKGCPDVVFLVDPPYLSTDVGNYNMSWRLSDYLDVLTVLKDSRYVYFTSDKSDIIELCEWLGRNRGLGNPFEGAGRVDFKASLNYNSRYTDIMLYSKEIGRAHV